MTCGRHALARNPIDWVPARPRPPTSTHQTRGLAESPVAAEAHAVQASPLSREPPVTCRGAFVLLAAPKRRPVLVGQHRSTLKAWTMAPRRATMSSMSGRSSGTMREPPSPSDLVHHDCRGVTLERTYR